MSKKLKYKIISCSSEQNQFPSSELLFGGQNGGWQTKRFCTYPQEVTFEFYGTVKVDKIQIISDNRKIPSQVDILYFLPFQQNGRQSEERFQKYGYLNFNKNQNSQFRQQKSIMVDIKCLYLRFLFHKPHSSKQNFFSQIGIQQISIYGNDSTSTFAPLQKLPRQIGQSGNNYDQNDMEEDPFVSQKIGYLNTQKQKAVQAEDFQTANQFKIVIDQVRKVGEQLQKLQLQKRKAIQQQDYEKANDLKRSVQKHKQDINDLISFQYEADDNVNEQNQFVTENNGNQTNMNDFQDNEFVDPEMNEMIRKSGSFSKSNEQNGQTSRLKIGTSRVKINRSMIKKQKQKTQFQNYQDRVVPALAGGNKLKTQQSQQQEKEEQKKVQYQPEQIDGKYIQFALILQDHFQEDTVKRFFSQHWQLKVQALSTIQGQIKKKQNADAGFIKCLIVVVKNSISQTNFQISLNSLQILGDLIKLNSRGNALNRSNEVSNDLDSISKQTIKKMTDNNNKIRQQAQKVFKQMIKSSLYGPQICMVALTKSKQKVKLSAKQLLSRLNQVQYIVQSNANNGQILNMATDFGIQNAKNPAIQVRNQSINLLIICKGKDSSGVLQKKLAEKQIATLLEAHQNKGGLKAGTQKIKKKK